MSHTFYRCFQCPALFWTDRELVSHRAEHVSTDGRFWSWYLRKWAADSLEQAAAMDELTRVVQG